MHVKEANAAFIRLTISENANRVGVAQVYAVGYIHSVFANEDIMLMSVPLLQFLRQS